MREQGIVTRLREARRLYAGFKRDDGVLLGAAVAYYSLFAFAPMLMIAAFGAVRLMGTDRVVEEFEAVVRGVIGAQLAASLSDVLLASTTGKVDAGLSIMGIGLSLWAVGVAYMHLHASLNVMWHVRAIKCAPWLVRARIQAPRLVLGLVPASMLAAATLTSSVLAWAADRSRLPAVDAIVTGLGSPAATALSMWISLCILYWLVPDARVRLSIVVLPAAVVAAAWAFGTYLYGIYLTWAGTQSVSGAAGAVFLLLVWMNYSARAVLFGAWWCRWRAEREGDIEPLPLAERVDGQSSSLKSGAA